MNKTHFISFRVKPKEKEYLNLLAKAEDMKISELIREMILKKISKERRLINNK